MAEKEASVPRYDEVADAAMVLGEGVAFKDINGFLVPIYETEEERQVATRLHAR